MQYFYIKKNTVIKYTKIFLFFVVLLTNILRYSSMAQAGPAAVEGGVAGSTESSGSATGGSAAAAGAGESTSGTSGTTSNDIGKNDIVISSKEVNPMEGASSPTGQTASGIENMKMNGKNDSLATVLDKILEIAQYAGGVMVAAGLVQMGLALKDDNADKRAQGIIAIIGGVLAVSLRVTLNALGFI